MKTIEDMKLELLSDNSNKFMQTLIDYDIKSKDKYGFGFRQRKRIIGNRM